MHPLFSFSLQKKPNLSSKEWNLIIQEQQQSLPSNLVEMQNNNAKEEKKREDSRPAIWRLGLIGLTKVNNSYQLKSRKNLVRFSNWH